MAGLINYVKKVFKNYPDTTTPMTAENLNHLDNGIFDLDQAVKSAIDDINNDIDGLNNDLSDKVSGFTETTYSAVTGLAYDSINKKLGLKVGADTVIPFSSKPFEYAITLFAYDNSSGGGDYFYAVTDFTKSDVKLSTSGIHESWGTIPFSSNNYLTCVNQPSGIHSATFTVKKACWYRPNSNTAFTRLAANTTITRTSMWNSSMGLAFIFD